MKQSEMNHEMEIMQYKSLLKQIENIVRDLEEAREIGGNMTFDFDEIYQAPDGFLYRILELSTVMD